MKNKLFLSSIATTLGIILSGGAAFAASPSATPNANTSASVGLGNIEVTSSSQTDASISNNQGERTTDDSDDHDKVKNKTSDQKGDDSQNDQKESDKKSNPVADEHRSTVSLFVQSLLNVANRDQGGIGAQVKVIAQAQNDSEKSTDEAIQKLEHRSSFKTFFVGTDYTSIGEIRSEMQVTANHINQLKTLADRTTDASVKAELQAQITLMEKEQLQLEAFLKAHESQFSLFGWLFK